MHAGYFAEAYPLAMALGCEVIDHAGFVIDDVKAELGEEKAAALDKFLDSKAVFSTPARKQDGVEAHCVYAEDLEAFLKGDQ